MNAVTIGLVGAGLAILAAATGRAFMSGLLLASVGIVALALFALAPASFASTLMATAAAFAIWIALPSGMRTAQVLAAGACGLLCAAVVPHLVVLVAEQPLASGLRHDLVRPLAALGAVIVGAGIAGLGGSAFALVSCAFGLGLLNPESAANWALPVAVLGATALARHSTLAATAALCATSLLTILGT
ncbi:hypothetical protein ACSSV8_003711 [Roseovarius sp. MBR-79]|jgi:hypothetical protein